MTEYKLIYCSVQQCNMLKLGLILLPPLSSQISNSSRRAKLYWLSGQNCETAFIVIPEKFMAQIWLKATTVKIGVVGSIQQEFFPHLSTCTAGYLVFFVINFVYKESTFFNIKKRQLKNSINKFLKQVGCTPLVFHCNATAEKQWFD